MSVMDDTLATQTRIGQIVISRSMLDELARTLNASTPPGIESEVTGAWVQALTGRTVDDVFHITNANAPNTEEQMFVITRARPTRENVGGLALEFRLWDAATSSAGDTLPIMAYDLEGEMYSRVDGIFETRRLAGRRVTIVGLGSFGSCVAEELVRCGVDAFFLIDFDRLESQNIVRHTCDLDDLGRYKTRAVADRIRRVNPRASVECLEVDVLAAGDEMDSIVANSALVLVCTDNNASRFFLNERALLHGVPAIYGGAYERAFGGHVIRVVPGETPCYECVVGGVLSRMGVAAEGARGNVAYLGASGEQEFVAEPGLGLDARFIAMIQAKMALLTLLRGTESSLEDFPSDLVFWGNCEEWIFPSPLYAQFAETTFRAACSACGEMA